MKLIPSEALEKLEFEKVCKLVERRCLSRLTIKHFQSAPFYTDLHQLDEQLALVVECRDMIEAGLSIPLTNAIDISEELEFLIVEDYILDLSSVVTIRKMLQNTADLFRFLKKQQIDFPGTYGLISSLEFNKNLILQIDKVVDEKGEVLSSASERLTKVRRSILKVRSQLSKVFAHQLKQYKDKKYLTDTQETVRNGRRVLSVRSESKRAIPGIIHGMSDSGKITYIEPEAAVFMSNELVEWENEERIEILRILKALCDELRKGSTDLEDYQHLLVQMDLLLAKARYAYKINGHRPKLVAKRNFRLIEAKHPLLIQKMGVGSKELVPLNLQLDKAERIVVISGPNAGGKSVCLKTVGLLQLMLQKGLLLPLDENSHMGLFTELFCEIGDSQSIEDELSTYSSHLKSMNEFIANASGSSLFLIDEFGTGTDPKFGGPLAQVILEQLADQGAFGLVTTHYSQLKRLASAEESIVNAAMIFDEETLSPTYRLETGKPGSSYTFYIAEKSGLPANMIEKARKLSDTDDVKVEQLLNELDARKEKIVRQEEQITLEDRQLKSLMKRYESSIKELEEQKKRLKYELKMKKLEELTLAESHVREMLKELKKGKNREQAVLEKLHQIRTEKEQITSETKQIHRKILIKDVDVPIEVGMQVRLLDRENPGMVEEIRGKQALVAFGNIRTRVKLSELVPLKTENIASKKQIAKKKVQYEEVEIKQELDVRGLRRDVAMKQIETFVDSAIVRDVPKFRIIHGRGLGILQKTVWQMLKGYREVKRFQFEDSQAGGEGATIVEL